MLDHRLALGNVCSITNFDVEMYKSDDKFRTVMHEYRLIFGEDTKVKHLDEKEAKLPDDTFDFYDHDDLLKIANENVYLTGFHIQLFNYTKNIYIIIVYMSLTKNRLLQQM